MPRSAPREGEYVEDRGSRARVLLDGDTETCVVLRERVKPARVVVGVDWASGPDVSIEWPRPPASDAVMALRYAMRAVPKPPKPWRDAKYLRFVRDFDCCWCGAATRIEAHHHGPHAMGQKTDDARCIPVCRTCHRHYHEHGAFNADERLGADGTDTDVVARAAQAECLQGWFAHKGLDADAVIVDALIAHLRESKS